MKYGVLTAYFCFTAKGYIFFLLSLCLLITGMLRADLASLLWASAFLLITCYTLIGNILLRLAVKRRLHARAGSFDLKLPARGVFPGSTAQARLRVELPAWLLPGFLARFFLRLTWQDHAACTVQALLAAGENTRIIPFTPAIRGEYRAPEARILIRDLIGFTNSSVDLPFKEELKVYPLLQPLKGKLPRFEAEGARIEYAPRKKRSEELLEIRKYYPGDDVRKINWKIFARYGELFLRIGEENTLPEARLLMIIDPTQSPLVPSPIRERYLELIVQRAGSFLHALLEQGVNAWLAVPGYGKPRNLSSERQDTLLACLARIWWQEEYRATPLPDHKNLHVLIFTSPGSQGLETLIRRLKKIGRPLSLLFPAWTEEDRAVPRLNLKHALFLDRPGNRGAPAGHWDQAGFLHTIDDEVRKYRNNPWRIGFVKQV